MLNIAALIDQDRVELFARDDSRNIRRCYVIERSPDLFGFTIVERHWGRAGTAGQWQRAAFPDDHAANRFVAAILKRRSTAPRRIGAAYQVIEHSLPMPLQSDH
jgi:predicted DNA-binding WGR domain protein